MATPRPDRADSLRRGFSLAELMLVLAILALAGLIVAPTIGRMALGEERRVREGVIEMVRSGQLAATEKGLPVSVIYEPGPNRLTVLDRRFDLPSGWWARTTAEEQGGQRRGGIRTVEEITGREPPPRIMMVWSPGGLVSQCDWVVVSEGGVRIRVRGDSIDGVRVE